ncbi:MAG: methyltransferase domain-containing protein [Verrucomicrobiota bacterium]|nr:methyltransferase domain-containing protein [Verrucomicrobiota bacterium]
MSDPEVDTSFTGSVPKLYERYLVPLIFEPYAPDIVSRLPAGSVTRVLEVAAGTGVVTRELARVLPGGVTIVATDLNEAMIEHAESLGTARPVEWKQADAAALPFPDESFDAVLCQFGVAFFSDKTKAFAEARRVLRPGGVFLFSTWDRIEENQFVDTVTKALESLFPDDPPRFHARVPHGYHDTQTIERDMAAAGFAAPEIMTVAKESRGHSAREVAMAYCQGTPLRNEIEERDASLLGDATVVAIKALTERFGKDDPVGKIQAHVVKATK